MRLSLEKTANVIAEAMLAGDGDPAGMVERATTALGKQDRWLDRLAVAAAQRFGPRWEDTTQQELARFIAIDEGFHLVWHSAARPSVIRLVKRPPRQRPPAGPLAHVALPQLPTAGDLAAWMNLDACQLDWFADRWRASPRQAALPLHHYLYKRVEKRDGRARLIEIPKTHLRALQRRLLRHLLDNVPPHPAAHGFRNGRNIVTFATPHADRGVVIRLDLADFFVSIPAARVVALYRTLGYPPEVARLLARLCTNRVPDDCLREVFPRGEGNPRIQWQEYHPYRARHLPQGAPTSPALANLCAFRLDTRLAGLARSFGAVYTRYADDLAFSGTDALACAAGRFCLRVAAIALEEGFAVQHRKTRIMRQCNRQQLAGVVINRHPNLSREAFDRLKAVLTNCIRHGPASQNREARADFRAHLAGRVAQATQLNAARGAKLRRLFERIAWSEPCPGIDRPRER